VTMLFTILMRGLLMSSSHRLFSKMERQGYPTELTDHLYDYEMYALRKMHYDEQLRKMYYEQLHCL
jgi:hypothetical protein